jgi:hypothetical protein
MGTRLSKHDTDIIRKVHRSNNIYILKDFDLLPTCAKSIAEHYAKLSNVRAIATIGSLASKKNDMYSDVDMVIVCNDQSVPSPKDRIKIINDVPNKKIVMNTINHQTWLFGASEDFVIDGQEICTQFFTKNQMLEVVAQITTGSYQQFGMEHPLAFLNSINSAIIHVDKDGFFKDLKSKIHPFPRKLQKTILSYEGEIRFPYYLRRLQTAVARGDIPYANKMVNNAIDSALYILFARHKQYPHGPKRLYQQIAKFMDESYASNLCNCLEEILSTGNTISLLPRKSELLNDLFIMVNNTPRPCL